MRLSILLICLAVTVSVYAQEKALKEYDQIFIEAKKADKNVVFVFGHKHCGWCRVFDRYHADAGIKEILEIDYIIHKIDIIESRAGKRLYNQYKLPGTPAWMIFDSEEKLLSDGKNENGLIIGYPYKQSGIELYFGEIRKTSDRIDES